MIQTAVADHTAMDATTSAIALHDKPSSLLFLLGSLPVVIPPLGRRVICLHAAVLNREQISKDALFIH